MTTDAPARATESTGVLSHRESNQNDNQNGNQDQDRSASKDGEPHHHYIRWQTRHNRTPELRRILYWNDQEVQVQIIGPAPESRSWWLRDHEGCPGCLLNQPRNNRPEAAGQIAAIAAW